MTGTPRRHSQPRRAGTSRAPKRGRLSSAAVTGTEGRRNHRWTRMHADFFVDLQLLRDSRRPVCWQKFEGRNVRLDYKGKACGDKSSSRAPWQHRSTKKWRRSRRRIAPACVAYSVFCRHNSPVIYRIRGALPGPNGRALRVVTIWMSEEATGRTKFITLYPDKA